MAGDGVLADFSIFETEAWEQRQECAVTNIPYSRKCLRGCVVAKGQWKGAHPAHPHRRCVGPTTWRLLSQLPNYGWKANTWNYVNPTWRPTSALSMVVPLEPCSLMVARSPEVATFLSGHWRRASQLRARLAQFMNYPFVLSRCNRSH